MHGWKIYQDNYGHHQRDFYPYSPREGEKPFYYDAYYDPIWKLVHPQWGEYYITINCKCHMSVRDADKKHLGVQTQYDSRISALFRSIEDFLEDAFEIKLPHGEKTKSRTATEHVYGRLPVYTGPPCPVFAVKSRRQGI